MQAARGSGLDAWGALRTRPSGLAVDPRTRVYVGYALELVALLVWVLIVTRPLQNMDPGLMLGGREAAPATQSHHLWAWVRECGACAMWNGSASGGYPAFSEIYGSMLHPVVAATTLSLGVVNGVKMTLIVAFFTAAVAQWWLAWLLGVGWLGRVWSGALAVVGGHLASRLDDGNFGLVLSTVFASLAFPTIIYFVKAGSRRAAAGLAVVLALVAVAGQGYLQFALLVTFPAALLLLPIRTENLATTTRRLLLAVVLAGLLAAPFLLPAVGFLPNVVKEGGLPFDAGQPLRFVPFNLAIDDAAYYKAETLGKPGIPSVYSLYVGWIPILLAIYGVVTERDLKRRWIVAYLLGVVFIAFWLMSGGLLSTLGRVIPLRLVSDLINNFRFYPFMGALAVPPILGLSALGVQRLVDLSWPVLKLTPPADAARSLLAVSTRWLLLVPLGLALFSAYRYVQPWIRLEPVNPAMAEMAKALQTDELQWVAPPFGEMFWREALIGKGLKLNAATMGWGLRDRPTPEPQVLAIRGALPPDYRQVATANNAAVGVTRPGREYAAVTHANQARTVCTAQGRGGNVDVTCSADQPGVLTVEENAFPGWQASIDGQPVALRDARWLSVDVPPGAHTIAFRYRPWDVPLGLGLMVVGLGLALYLVWRGDRSTTAPAQAPEAPQPVNLAR